MGIGDIRRNTNTTSPGNTQREDKIRIRISRVKYSIAEGFLARDPRKDVPESFCHFDLIFALSLTQVLGVIRLPSCQLCGF